MFLNYKIILFLFRFFIDPLLNEETVSKEINAVNSEYTNDLTDPNWVHFQ